MQILDELSPMAHWFLRIALGSVFLFHGLTKFPAAQQMASQMQMPVFVVILIALAETAGGLFVLVGSFFPGWVTRLGGLLIVPVMLGAIFMVHWGQWAFMPSETHPMGGMEFQVTLLLIALFFVFRGNEEHMRI